MRHFRKIIFYFFLAITILLTIYQISPKINLGILNNYFTKHDSNSTEFRKKINDTSSRDLIPGMEKFKGVRYRIYNSEGEIDNKYNYYIKNAEEWDKFISFSHMLDSPSVYKLLLFIDYNQANFNVDGKYIREFTFKMDANKTIEIPVKISNLKPGTHDILFLIVKDPNIKSLDKKFRITTSYFNVLPLRCTITKSYEIMNKYSINYFKQSHIKDNFTNIIINNKQNENIMWLSDKININSNLHFYTHICNNDVSISQRYAVITLLDWKQVSNKNNSVYFVEIDKGKEIIIPWNIQKLKAEGVHELTSIIISNPFEKIDKYNNHVFSSARVGIFVVKGSNISK